MGKVVTVIIIILIIVGGYYLFKGGNTMTVNQGPSGSTSTGETQNPSSKATVNYTDNGFSPQTVTIKLGETVTFVNQSSGAMWVASNPHPLHNDYPGFDEKKTVGKGGTYEFTFQKAGSWGYHNHQNPSRMGTVVVQ